MPCCPLFWRELCSLSVLIVEGVMQAAAISDVLKSMSAAGPEAWGVPIGIGEFAEILVRLDRQRDGFDGSDVARVEAMWAADVEPDFAWSGGFVVALKDGRRAYV